MKTDALMKELETELTSHADLPWIHYYTNSGIFRPDGSPHGSVKFQEVGKWLSIIVVFEWKGTTMDQTTDRASGNPYTGAVRYDWIGLAETAPSFIKSRKELDDWAGVSLKYSRENTDVGVWGVHEGSWVESFREDGTVIIRDVKGRYEDEDPQSLGESRIVQLEN